MYIYPTHDTDNCILTYIASSRHKHASLQEHIKLAKICVGSANVHRICNLGFILSIYRHTKCKVSEHLHVFIQDLYGVLRLT